MRTSYLFLDRLFALRAFSCVVLDPRRVGLLGVYECVPSLNVLTCHWIVRLLAAFVTVQFSAWTCHCVYLHHVWLYAEIWAFLVGAVADVLVLDRDGVYETFEDWRFLAVRLMHAGREDPSIV